MYHDPVEWLLGVVVGALLLLLAALITDYASGSFHDTPVTVLATHYEGVRSGVGTGVGANGQVTTVVTTSGPAYHLSVEFADGARDIVETNKQTLLGVTNGDIVDLSCWRGGFSDSIYSCRR
jgi:hypothetical protein